MELAKNSLLTDIIDILALNNRQQDNLENIICDVETKFVERGRSTKNLLNKIEDSIKIGTDLGLITANEDDNTIRLKFNPHRKAPMSLSRYYDTNDQRNQYYIDSESDQDDENKDNDEISERQYLDDAEAVDDEDDDADDGKKNNDNEEYKNQRSKVPHRYRSIMPNYYPSTSKSQTRSIDPPSADVVSTDKPKKRKSNENNSQRRTRRKY